MKQSNIKGLLTLIFILLFAPIALLAQGTEIAMERLSQMFIPIGNIALAVAIINFLLLICYWFTKKDWLGFLVLILSVPSVLFGLAAYQDDPWVAKICLFSGVLPVLIPIFRKIFKR
ncbi:MAG: hypothetical protein HYZ42_10810 [Bacteroidetes bacterium]|nr:hypothetical protein [Bacteroidota bacterium]